MVYFLRQLAFFLAALWLAATFTFFLPQILGHAPLDGALLPQYLDYLGRLLHLDFGMALRPPEPVKAAIGDALPWTLLLIGSSTILAFILGTLLGVAVAWRRGGLLDSLLTPLAMFCGAVPFYFFALLIIWLFALQLGRFPAGGAYSDTVWPHLSGSFALDVAAHTILPAFALVLATIGLWLLPMRNAMVSTLAEDYIALARAKGLPASRIALAYAARNALLPALTNFGVQLGFIISGALFVEVAFSYPGVGLLLVTAVSSHDYPLIQALILLSAASALLANFLVNLLYARLDPRVRSG